MKPSPHDLIPWDEKPGRGRVRPRECVWNAKDALDKAYRYGEAPIPLLIEAVDWLRRAMEQMVPPETESHSDFTDSGGDPRPRLYP